MDEDVIRFVNEHCPGLSEDHFERVYVMIESLLIASSIAQVLSLLEKEGRVLS